MKTEEEKTMAQQLEAYVEDVLTLHLSDGAILTDPIALYLIDGEFSYLRFLGSSAPDKVIGDVRHEPIYVLKEGDYDWDDVVKDEFDESDGRLADRVARVWTENRNWAEVIERHEAEAGQG